MIVYTVTGPVYIGDYSARAVQQELLHTAKTGQNAVKGPVKGTITAVEAGDETGVSACPDSLAFAAK